MVWDIPTTSIRIFTRMVPDFTHCRCPTLPLHSGFQGFRSPKSTGQPRRHVLPPRESLRCPLRSKPPAQQLYYPRYRWHCLCLPALDFSGFTRPHHMGNEEQSSHCSLKNDGSFSSHGIVLNFPICLNHKKIFWCRKQEPISSIFLNQNDT